MANESQPWAERVPMLLLLLLLLLLPVVGAPAGGGPEAPTTVLTAAGAVRGRVYGGCRVWRGIPFGAPPTGELRWRAPRAHAGWSGVRDATEPAQQCPQLDILRGEHFGSEDCLYLSVYSPPQCTRERPCATLFWIYGGAWTIGGNGEFGLYTGEHLAEQHGVVVVAANYRLDVLGWLALEDLAEESGYGNYGLRDQRLAMQWTRDNVAGFGGDPERVTIFGESAGGFSVCQHLTAPASNGLFSRAIIESGGCSGPWLIQDGVNAKRFGDSYATAVGCAPDAVPGARARCMRRKTPAQVMEPYTSWLCPPGHRRHPLRPNDPWCNISAAAAAAAPAAAAPSAGAAGGRKGALNSSQPQPQLQPQLQLEWPSTRPPLAPVAGWTAVVDGTAEGLLDTPLNLIKQGRINSGPKGQPLQVIIGTNQDEMALFIAAMDLLVPGVALPPQPEALPKLVRRKTLHFASLHFTPCHVFPFHFRQQKAPLF
jgi:hypothetical protein